MVTLTPITMYRERYFMTIRKKKFEYNELEKVQRVEEPTAELVKELIQVNKDIREILSRLKDRFI